LLLDFGEGKHEFGCCTKMAHCSVVAKLVCLILGLNRDSSMSRRIVSVRKYMSFDISLDSILHYLLCVHTSEGSGPSFIFPFVGFIVPQSGRGPAIKATDEWPRISKMSIRSTHQLLSTETLSDQGRCSIGGIGLSSLLHAR
jgi:hypothetical protein